MPGNLRFVVAEKVRQRMDEIYKDSSNRTLALAKDAKVSHSTVQRIIKADVGTSLDSLEAIADKLKLPTYQLLIPDERHLFSTGRDATNQPTLLHEQRTRYPVRRAK
jgi:DhnA family fructose-bisphosphate aldolase class Ia